LWFASSTPSLTLPSSVSASRGLGGRRAAVGVGARSSRRSLVGRRGVAVVAELGAVEEAVAVAVGVERVDEAVAVGVVPGLARRRR
jgi:hypothetical protein